MNDSHSSEKDPVCGMTVNTTTALQGERNGKKFYFCSEKCRTTFLAPATGAKVDSHQGGCCG